MDRLPIELVRLILKSYVEIAPKNEALNARFVSSTFDEILQPDVLRTLNIDFSRLSRTSRRCYRQIDGIQSVGYRCEALFIDLMLLRDEHELDFLDTIFARIPSMRHFCVDMRRRYSLNPDSFTENEYLHSVGIVLSFCPRLKSLRLNLPCQLVCPHSGSATRIIANTFKALATHANMNVTRPGGGLLKILVLDNLADGALLDLWANPLDITAAKTSMRGLDHLVLILRHFETQPNRVRRFGSALWEFVKPPAGRTLQSLALIGLDREDFPWRVHRAHTAARLSAELWSAHQLVCPPQTLAGISITCLELRHIQISPADLEHLLVAVGPALEELYLHDIYLGVTQTTERNRDGNSDLWVGLPSQTPPDGGHWIAFKAYQVLDRLRVCRARGLYYDRHIGDGMQDDPDPDLDRHDPCGRGRQIGQRFVEVVMGVPQPPDRDGNSPTYLVDEIYTETETETETESYTETYTQTGHLDPRRRQSSREKLGRQDVKRAVDYDTLAYQTTVANTTSRWLKSLDGNFKNHNPSTARNLRWIAETVGKGMGHIHERRNEAEEGASIVNEFMENVTMGLTFVNE